MIAPLRTATLGLLAIAAAALVGCSPPIAATAPAGTGPLETLEERGIAVGDRPECEHNAYAERCSWVSDEDSPGGPSLVIIDVTEYDEQDAAEEHFAWIGAGLFDNGCHFGESFETSSYRAVAGTIGASPSMSLAPGETPVGGCALAIGDQRTAMIIAQATGSADVSFQSTGAENPAAIALAQVFDDGVPR